MVVGDESIVACVHNIIKDKNKKRSKVSQPPAGPRIRAAYRPKILVSDIKPKAVAISSLPQHTVFSEMRSLLPAWGPGLGLLEDRQLVLGGGMGGIVLNCLNF